MEDSTKIRIAAFETGCTRHAFEALHYLRTNDWSDERAPSVRPRQYIAARTLGKATAFVPGLAYAVGRRLRDPELKRIGALDEWVDDAVSDYCSGVCADRAYMVEYPLSWTLDKVVGIVAGVAIAPAAFVAGLVYTPSKKAEQQDQSA